MDLLRSLLFVPGNRKDMLEKAVTRALSDALVADMEDSVPDAEKSAAREIIAEMLPALVANGHKIVVRVNALDTGILEEDMNAAISEHTYAVNVGKVENRWDVAQVDAIMSKIEKSKGMQVGTVKLVLFIESALAIVNAYELCSSSPRIVAVAFGAEDYTVDMGIERTEEGSEVLVPRATVAMAARAANVIALDPVYANFQDIDGFKVDAELGKSLGYKGKFAIHPSQIEHINDVYSPSEEDIEYAKKVVAAFREAEEQGRGAVALDGKMIDVPVVKRAESLLNLADAIANRGK